MKHSKIFIDLLDLSEHDRKAWMDTWQLMTKTHGAGIEALAQDLFGDVSLPYPEMDLFSMFIRFNTSPPVVHPILLRVVLAIEPKMEVFNCEICASDIMILDYVNQETAVKIHIPVTQAVPQRRCKNWQEFSILYQTEIWDEDRSWTELGSMFQGWSEQFLYRYKGKPLEDVFDENGSPEYVREFQPFQSEYDWGFHKGARIRSEQTAKEDEDNDIFDPMGDDSDDQFDPFLEGKRMKWLARSDGPSFML